MSSLAAARVRSSAVGHLWLQVFSVVVAEKWPRARLSGSSLCGMP